MMIWTLGYAICRSDRCMGVSVAMASRSERCGRSISRRMDQELYRVDQKGRESGAGTARAVSNPISTEVECWTRYAGSNTTYNNLYWRILAPLFFFIISVLPNNFIRIRKTLNLPQCLRPAPGCGGTKVPGHIR
jgi:hypothetical protein